MIVAAGIADPTPSAWVFFLANFVVVAGYVFASLMITRRKGIARAMTWRAWAIGITFFACCAATHVGLALHAFFNSRIVELDGSVAWWVVALHAAQAVFLMAFLWAVQVDPRMEPDVPRLPLEAASVEPTGAAHDCPPGPDHRAGTG